MKSVITTQPVTEFLFSRFSNNGLQKKIPLDIETKRPRETSRYVVRSGGICPEPDSNRHGL
jgi:hypothetical protein